MADEPTLTRGERGDWVVYAKQMLEFHGVEVEDRDDDLEDDDEYGRRTARAIRKFQRHNGLDVTGKIDEQTWQLLRDQPDPERKPPGKGQDEDEDSEDEDDDDYRQRRDERDTSEGRSPGGSGSGGDDDEAGGGVTSGQGWLSGIADQLGIELEWAEEEKKPKLEITGDPWIDDTKLSWLVKNSGTGDSAYHATWFQVVDANNVQDVMLYTDYQETDKIAAGDVLGGSLEVSDLNQLAGDQMKQFDDISRYLLQVSVGMDGDWSETVDLEFEVVMEENEGEGEDRQDFVKVARFRRP